jgi:hypothetical protein
VRALFLTMLALCASGPRNADAVSVLNVDPSCAAGNSISVRLFLLDDPWNPSPLPPEWVGYDLFREPADLSERGVPGARERGDHPASSFWGS